jgi:bifunctional non-homologous end joining protein LigD
MTKQEVRIGRRTLSLSKADKTFWSDDGITKGDLVAYYTAIAPVMVPHLKDRLLTMERYPDGYGGGRFYQKDASEYFPEWITRKRAPKEGGKGTVDYVVCNEAATLVYLANQACMTFHTSLHRIDRLERPDLFIMDLDPSTEDFSIVRHAALATRELLVDLGLTPFVKTSGSRGLHVVVPLRRTGTFAEVRQFARLFAQVLESRNPDELTTEHRKAKRGDRLFLDVMRNGYGAHAVAPYSVRARPHAPVAMPIEWSEVEDDRLTPTRYTLRDAVAVVEKRGDLWSDMRKDAGSIAGPAKRLASTTND